MNELLYYSHATKIEKIIDAQQDWLNIISVPVSRTRTTMCFSRVDNLERMAPPSFAWAAVFNSFNVHLVREYCTNPIVYRAM
jgi:hypothetical protein